LGLIFVFCSIAASSLTGKVARVVDGDTLYVLDTNCKQHKIRLARIDAPERKQAYGLTFRKHVVSIVAGQQVIAEYQKRDRYGLIVGKVLLDGIDVCLEQVEAGFAVFGVASYSSHLVRLSTACPIAQITH
jgi:endonuclease YncB( thermonuclease family)